MPGRPAVPLAWSVGRARSRARVTQARAGSERMEPQSSRPLEQTFGVGSPAPSPRGARADAYAPSPRGRGVPVASGPDAELEGREGRVDVRTLECA